MNILVTLSFKYIRTTFSLEYLHILPIRGVSPPVHEHKALFRLRMSSGLKRLCVQTNKYSKLHKCPGPEHVEFFKEFQVAPKGIKKLISLPKETLNSNVKTRT